MSIQEWKKLGYSDEEAEELHKLAEKSAIDSYGKINIDEATQALISCMKAFEIDLSDERIQDIIDKFNEIPETYVIPNDYHGWEVKLEKK